MSDRTDLIAKKQAERTARDARLAQALRDNLRRRKDQARGRERPAAPPPDASGLSRTLVSSKSNRRGGTTAD